MGCWEIRYYLTACERKNFYFLRSQIMVYCKCDVYRSVAQAACVLIGVGYNADDAMQLIQEKRVVADPYVGYIQKRIRLFEKK